MIRGNRGEADRPLPPSFRDIQPRARRFMERLELEYVMYDYLGMPTPICEAVRDAVDAADRAMPHSIAAVAAWAARAARWFNDPG